MKNVTIEFGSDRLDFELDDSKLIGSWSGPGAAERGDVSARAVEALESPLDYPPLRQAVVPGDKVTIAIDPATPGLGPILAEVLGILTAAGVEAGDVRLLAGSTPPQGWNLDLPPEVEWTVHDPEDRAGIAYLAATPEGRRVYLNRHVTDADFVLALGRFAFDRSLGYRGPWSAIFPDLSDAETIQAFRADSASAPRRAWHDRSAVAESAAVSWLLGSQLQVGVLPAASGVATIIAGTEAKLMEVGRQALDESWTFRPGSRAELVVIGAGAPGWPAGFEELADGLATAIGLVEPGGRIAVLSNVVGSPGPALGRLVGVEEPDERRLLLKETEAEPDHPVAKQLAAALAKARVYLLSDLEEELVEDLGLIALGKPTEVRRLVESARSVLFVNRAEATRAVVTAESDLPAASPADES